MDRDPVSWLAESLAALGDALRLEAGSEAYWPTLMDVFSALLQPAAAWVLAVDRHRRPRLVAAAGRHAADLAALEVSAQRGPGLDRIPSGEQLSDVDFGHAPASWSPLIEQARRTGLHFAHGFPLGAGADSVGVLSVLTVEELRLPADVHRSMDALTDVAAIGIAQRQAIVELRNESRQLHMALDSRVVIEQAKGIIAARVGVGIPAAFKLLRRHARDHNRRIGAVAADVVTGVLTSADVTAGVRSPTRLPSGARRPRPSN